MSRADKGYDKADERTALLSQAPPPYDSQPTASTSASASTPAPSSPSRSPPTSPPFLFSPIPVFFHPRSRSNPQQYFGPTPYHFLPPPSTYELEFAMRRADRRARRRFWSAMVWGFLLWLGLGWVLGWAAEHGEEIGREARRGYRKGVVWMGEGERWAEEHVWGPDGILHRWDSADIEGVTSCARFATLATESSPLAALHPLTMAYTAFAVTPVKEATASFIIPVDAIDELTFTGVGGWSEGQITFAVDDKLIDEARVSVLAVGNDNQLLQDAHVCQTAGKRKAGLVVRTPSRYGVPLSPHTQLSFDVLVSLPRSYNSTLKVTNADFADFAVTGSLPALSDGRLEIITANKPIVLTGPVTATQVLLSTSNARISTDGITAASITAKTSNGPITTGELDGAAVLLSTSNEGIQSLLSANFEGTVVLTTSNRDATLTGPGLQERDGLRRHLDNLVTTGPTTSADVYWGDSRGSGKATFHTSNADVSVHLL